MENTYKYLIVGGGMTAASAVEGIREVDPDGPIGLIGAEGHPPYDRPPLSKGLWKGKPLEGIWRKVEGPGVTLHLGRTVKSVDLAQKQVRDDQGNVHAYSKLLLATGGRPRTLPFGGDRVVYFRTFDDYQRLRSLTGPNRRFVVIGGGFIGSEIAAALTMNGQHVSLVFPNAAIGGRLFPPDLAGFLNNYYREQGVEVHHGQSVVNIQEHDGRSTLTLRDDRSGSEQTLEADGVVAGIGIVPNVELARAAGLTLDDGIKVDPSLRTSHPDVFAAGDAASFSNPALGIRIRVEHEDNANTMGKMAGRSMAGKTVSYDHLPSFYSDLFDLGFEAVGQIDARLETVADWHEPFREGVVYYLKDGRVRGVLLWNVWDQVDAARSLIAEPGPFQAEDLKGRLPS